MTTRMVWAFRVPPGTPAPRGIAHCPDCAGMIGTHRTDCPRSPCGPFCPFHGCHRCAYRGGTNPKETK